jgi:hypothetical protein
MTTCSTPGRSLRPTVRTTGRGHRRPVLDLQLHSMAYRLPGDMPGVVSADLNRRVTRVPAA